jgi:hypothetical protein
VNMKKHLKKFKFTAAFLLLVSFFLPMSSCSYTVPLEPGVNESGPVSGKSATERRTVIMYAREYIDFREPGSWLNLLSFTWPLLVITLQFRYNGKRALLLLPSTGMLLSVLSAAVIYAWADVGKPLIGAYVGWCAALALFVIYLAELAAGVKGKTYV